MLVTDLRLPRLDERHLKAPPQSALTLSNGSRKISKKNLAFMAHDDSYYAYKYEKIMEKSYYQEINKLDVAVKSFKTTKDLRNSILRYSYDEASFKKETNLSNGSNQSGFYSEREKTLATFCANWHKTTSSEHKISNLKTARPSYSGNHIVSKTKDRFWDPSIALPSSDWSSTNLSNSHHYNNNWPVEDGDKATSLTNTTNSIQK
jgi:hypothetical protein